MKKSKSQKTLVLEDSSTFMLKSPRRMTEVRKRKKTELPANFPENEEDLEIPSR